MTTRPTILIVCDYYLPGFESGGAMRTIVNMVDRLSDEFDFRIVTRCHDGPHNRKPYDNVRIGEWNRVGNADVYYVSRGKTGPGKIRSLIGNVQPEAIYVNSFFSPLTVAVLYLRKRGRISEIPVVLAPEGEFSLGALEIKRVKKRLYINSAKSLRLLHDITWKCASERELVEIQRSLGNIENVHIAPNLPPPSLATSNGESSKPPKDGGSARMVFLSRFMRKKNFNWLLENLSGVKGVLQIDIWGPIEDQEYWQETLRLIENQPPNIMVREMGAIPHDRVKTLLTEFHFFILPTLGENFGHVFVEAFEAGCPVITSDRTPWRDLEEKGIGWDLPLEDPERWVAVINHCLAMNGKEYSALSQRTREFAVSWLSAPELEESNREVLRAALAKRVI